ncbi:MAG: GNAT family N-acetyltransferase, partial [Longimicrobiales bacterium]|nr:GNAT family N-acetyltransferase [Longimicrobiales bacterium]
MPLPTVRRRTDRLTLRPLGQEDEGEYVRVCSESAEAWRPWIPAGEPGVSVQRLFRRELERSSLGARAGTHLRLAAFADDGSLVGLFALNEIVRGVFQSAYASWQVAADRMRRGYGTEGVRALLDLAFEDPPDG